MVKVCRVSVIGNNRDLLVLEGVRGTFVLGLLAVLVSFRLRHGQFILNISKYSFNFTFLLDLTIISWSCYAFFTILGLSEDILGDKWSSKFKLFAHFLIKIYFIILYLLGILLLLFFSQSLSGYIVLLPFYSRLVIGLKYTLVILSPIVVYCFYVKLYVKLKRKVINYWETLKFSLKNVPREFNLKNLFVLSMYFVKFLLCLSIFICIQTVFRGSDSQVAALPVLIGFISSLLLLIIRYVEYVLKSFDGLFTW